MGTSVSMRIYVASDLPCDCQGRPIYDLYARMSDGFDDKQLNIDGQFAAAERYVINAGGVVGERLSDPVSAWLPGVERPEWDRLVERMRTRQSAGASIWNIDRFLRQNRQLEELLDAVDQMGCRLLDSSGARNLDNEDDRFVLRIMVSQANKSSADTSRRVKNKFQLQREAGILNDAGARAFAWPGVEPAKPGQKRRKEVSAERLKDERKALEWAYKHIAGGGNLTEVAAKWNAKELFSYYGRPWSNVTVRQAMSKQRYAGRIEHRGQVVGVIADHKPTIEPELFDRVQGIFAARKLGRPQGQQSLGSGLIYCSRCGAVMISRPRYLYYSGGRKVAIPAYKCAKARGGCGGPQIDQDVVDEKLRAYVTKRLSDPSAAEAIAAARSAENDRASQVRAELETARATEIALAEQVRAHKMSWGAFSTIAEGLSADIQRLDAELKELEAAATDLDAVRASSALAVEQEWDAKRAADDIEGLRALVRSALPPRMVRVTIRPGVIEGVAIRPEERVELVAVGSGSRTTNRQVAVGNRPTK